MKIKKIKCKKRKHLLAYVYLDEAGLEYRGCQCGLIKKTLAECSRLSIPPYISSLRKGVLYEKDKLYFNSPEIT